MDFGRSLGLVAEVFERRGRPFALAGAAALAAYGITRATVDIDFVAEASAQDAVIADLEALGYRTLHRSAGYSNHLHPQAELGRLDFIYVDEGTARQILESARVVTIAGRRVRVPRPEHLAAMKVQAMKNDPTRTYQDLADVRLLLGLPSVDRAEIRTYFEKAGLAERFDELQRLS
jgi:hypothetical protein